MKNRKDDSKRGIGGTLAGAGVLAGGAGVGYAGLKAGQATSRLAPQVEETLKGVNTAAGQVNRAAAVPGKLRAALVKKLRGLAHGVGMRTRLAAKAAPYGKETRFGGDEQPIDSRGRKVGAWDVFTGSKKGYRPLRDAAGKIIGRQEIKADELPGGDILKNVYHKAEPVKRWAGRSINVAKDATDALRGKRKVDERGRPQKREWEKSWAQNRAKQAAAAVAIGGYGYALRKNIRIPVPSAAVRKWGKGAGKGLFTKVPLQKIHKGTIKAVRGKVNQVVPNFFPDNASALAAKLDDLTTRMARLVGGTVARLSEPGMPGSMTPATAFGYDDARFEGWDVRDPRGKSARVFAPGSQKRERREKRWSEKVENERKLWAGGVVTAAGLGALAGRKLKLRGKARAGLVKGERKAMPNIQVGGQGRGKSRNGGAEGVTRTVPFYQNAAAPYGKETRLQSGVTDPGYSNPGYSKRRGLPVGKTIATGAGLALTGVAAVKGLSRQARLRGVLKARARMRVKAAKRGVATEAAQRAPASYTPGQGYRREGD